MRSYAERLLEIGKFRRDFHRGPRLAHGLEINARRLAGTGAVAIPFIENQPRRWKLAVFWKAVVVLRPQPMHEEGIGSRAALHIAGHGVGAPPGSASAEEGWR